MEVLAARSEIYASQHDNIEGLDSIGIVRKFITVAPSSCGFPPMSLLSGRQPITNFPPEFTSGARQESKLSWEPWVLRRSLGEKAVKAE